MSTKIEERRENWKQTLIYSIGKCDNEGIFKIWKDKEKGGKTQDHLCSDFGSQSSQSIVQGDLHPQILQLQDPQQVQWNKMGSCKVRHNLSKNKT